MKKSITTAFALVAMMAIASPLYATEKDYGMDSDKTDTTGSQNISANEIEGMSLVSQSGMEIGEINSVKTDQSSGKVTFVTITKGGVLGIGGEDVAIPFEALRLDKQNEQAILAVSESMLDNAPQQADMSDNEFQKNLESHYGLAPAWDGKSDQMKTDSTKSMDMDKMNKDHTNSMDQNDMDLEVERDVPGAAPTPEMN